MRLEDAFPSWIVDLCNSPLGLSGTALALANMGDNVATYASYAARLNAWGSTVPNTNSTQTLPAVVPLPE